jgi:hypothetical protein
MRQLRQIVIILGFGILGLSNLASAQETPRAEQRAEQRGSAVEAKEPARAVLQITSEAGVCYWSIAGDDDLVRLPQMKDDRFSAILLSARFDNDQLHLTMAGEATPLDTVSLGQVDLGLVDGSPVTVDSIRALKSAAKGGWQLRVLPPHTKVDTSDCCSCGLTKLSCCPNKAYCMGCGVCGNCCG